jgi:hypothetical protein
MDRLARVCLDTWMSRKTLPLLPNDGDRASFRNVGLEKSCDDGQCTKNNNRIYGNKPSSETDRFNPIKVCVLGRECSPWPKNERNTNHRVVATWASRRQESAVVGCCWEDLGSVGSAERELQNLGKVSNVVAPICIHSARCVCVRGGATLTLVMGQHQGFTVLFILH